jgi:hypothetical protein
LGWQDDEELEHELHVEAVPGGTSGPQLPPPLLLELDPLLVPPLPLPEPLPQAPPRGTHALTWVPLAEERTVQASELGHAVPPVHVDAQ